MIEITDKEHFDKVTSENPVVLVDMFATWCGPCKMIAPALEEISNDYVDVTVAKLDVDKVSDVATDYEVMSVPTLLLFSEGDFVASKVGFTPKEQIEEFIKNNIS